MQVKLSGLFILHDTLHPKAPTPHPPIPTHVNNHVNQLPFLKPRAIPTERKLAGVSKYGFSEDDEVIEHALDELIAALHTKDSAQFMEALTALIETIKNKEPDDASDPFQDTQGV